MLIWHDKKHLVVSKRYEDTLAWKRTHAEGGLLAALSSAALFVRNWLVVAAWILRHEKVIVEVMIILHGLLLYFFVIAIHVKSALRSWMTTLVC